MIYAEKQNPDEYSFIGLLECTRQSLVECLKIVTSMPSSLEFEALVCQLMTDNAVGTEFENTIRQTGVAAFPDIIANGYYGVEVKTTTKDHWRSTGNSVLESLRETCVKRIYIVFGKLGGIPDVKYRLYQECLPEISVTHSPRYRVDMDLPAGESIFDKMGLSYDELRSSDDTIQQIKLYYRRRLRDGEGLWWIDEEAESASPVIKQFRTLTNEEKERYMIESMILFPELFKNKASYERAATHLITAFGAVSANLRDVFTAGGQKQVNIQGRLHRVPKMLFQLNKYASKIMQNIDKMDEGLLSFSWNIASINASRISQWQALIDEDSISHVSTSLVPSRIFQAGIDSVSE
jgi:hypothetical protein